MLFLLVACLCHWAAASLTITIPSSTLLPNPHLLPASTHATLTNKDQLLSASLTRSSTLVFHDIPSASGQSESYLLDIRSGEWVFAPYRVDVAADGTILGVWETFRGNAWDNRGTERYVVDVAGGQKSQTNVVVEAKVVARKGFYEERAKCESASATNSPLYRLPRTDNGPTVSPLSLVKNPMILLAVVALGFTLGMPKLMENSTCPPRLPTGRGRIPDLV